MNKQPNTSYEKQLLHIICKALPRKNRRVLRRQERKLQSKLEKDFAKQKNIINKGALSILDKYSEKTIDKDIDNLFDSLDDKQMIEHIIAEGGTAMSFGANYRIDKNNLAEIGIAFDLLNPLALEYLQTDRPLILAKMTDTTKAHIKPLIINAVETGQSPQELTKLIQSNHAFSKIRSAMIANYEVAMAYETGNFIPMKDAKTAGYESLKKWSTVNDKDVTPSHTENQEQDGGKWLDIDTIFEGTGDNHAPASDNPNCRCTTLYEIKT